ncbi:ribonuclease H-like domain-containing protein [Tanacetum coccineum]|uniref:Ribonuclease H-like domain-containing protein n=1 Tax=Tanacetum coccineum TaxID=301880 RepID=A0ABQ5IRS3_9ASTR
MGILNEHQLKFKSIKDAQSLLQAIKKRFGGNAATKKTYRNLLKQQYENFTASSSEKFLRSLSPEWNTHTIVWRNKPEIDTLSLDDIYNNLKIYEPEVKGTSISNTNTQNVAFVSSYSTNSTNGAVFTAHGATTASTQATIVNSTTIDNLSDVVICAFFMDLRWQMARLTMMARRFLKNTGRKFSVNGTETIRFDKSKVECYKTATKGDTLQGSAGIQETKKTGRGKTQEGLCQWRQLLLMLSSNSKKNESVYEEDMKVLKHEIHLREVAITELRRKLKLAQKQKDEIQLTVENFENSSKSLSKLIDCQIVDKCKTGLGYNVVPPPYTGNFMPPKPDLSFSGLEEFVNEPIVSEPTVKKPVVETSEAKASADKPKVVRKNNGAPIIEDWVSDSEEEDVPQAKKEKKTVKSSFAKIEFVKSKEQVKSPRKTTVKQVLNAVKGNQVNAVKALVVRLNPRVSDCGMLKHMIRNILGHILTDFNEMMEDMLHLEVTPKDGKIKAQIKGVQARTPQQNGVAERKNRTLIEAARTMLADSKLPTTFWAEAVNTTCYVQNRMEGGDKSPGVNMVRSMWLFKHKFHADGTLSCYKARLVANGSSQQLGVDFDETFSPVIKPATVRMVFSLVVSRKWLIHQLDVKNVFLNGDLSKTVYMHQPSGFVDNRYPHHVCLLQISLYGLKQAPRAWALRIKRLLDDLRVTAAKFNSIKDAKSLLQAIEKRFGGNAATKKTQRNLLKQHYEIFTASSLEKFLRSLSPEWNTHTIVWRNKPEIDTLSLDDLYNNMKIYEPKVKGTSSSNTNTQNVAFMSSNSISSTNGAVILLMLLQLLTLKLLLRDRLEVADGYANNEGKEILEEHWKKAYCEWAPRNHENKNRENTRRVVPVKTTTSNALISCDGLGDYDWKEFVNEPIVSETTIKKPVVETSEAKASTDKPKAVKKNNGAPIIEDWVSDSKEEDMPQAKIQKKTIKPSFAKIEFVKSKEQVKTPWKTTVKQGSNFKMINKACYVCGSFDHLQYDCNNHQRQFNNKKIVKPVWNYTQRVNHQNFSRMTHPSPKRNMVRKAVLMRSGLVSFTTAKPVNTAQPRSIVNSARPMANVFNKSHSTVRRPINNKTTTKNSNFTQTVNTVMLVERMLILLGQKQ